ncbi:helix-turn-helix transcriptional regulator [Bacillus sp. CLL-7-23]|uniref:Helix-turn-helix transcriptional regulator n=1 Tax=Bacillus changyiensis TaxID=3004103 RepID=A0ABT4X2F4_9BACI|nr:helix-turn-helix transcriptional regulator [Bacillus changyiensis]MDA7026365.1 helix-turn-helix transcriptional regulator [Bacillus changyiensis]
MKAIIPILKSVVPFDASCCTAIDPNNLLSIGSVTDQEIEAIHPQLFKCEYVYDDLNQYEHLLKTWNTAAILSETTNGALRQCRRYRNVLEPAGFADEMRVILFYKGDCWGYLTLYRKNGQPLFKIEERTLLTSLAPIIGEHLRYFRHKLPKKDMFHMKHVSGILILSAELSPLSCDQTALHWLTVLRSWEQLDNRKLPRPIRAVCTRVLKEAGPATAKTVVSIPGQDYLSIRASHLDHFGTAKQIVVLFEPVSPTEAITLMTEAYALSEREKDITNCVIRGLSTKGIADDLHISVYTVQDHLKSIFAKTGTRSRRELMWKLLDGLLN